MNGRGSGRRGVGRRTLLASGAAGVALSLSGCSNRVGSVVHTSSNQLSVTITTVPDDDDRQVNGIFQALESNLEAVGIDVSVDPRTTHEFERTVLFDNDFDLYVGRYPGRRDPDFLYELLHSRFKNEVGWQNPFGFSSIDLDEQLEAQRRQTGDERRETLADVLERTVVEKPFVPLCLSHENRVVREDRFDGWDRSHLADGRAYLALDPLEADDRLTVATTDARPTQNLNPLAAHYRDRGTVIDLLYDSLGTWLEGEFVPWLAADWERDGSELLVTIGSDCRFHDGESLDAADVAFTYEFLGDLSLGRAETPVPSPRYRRELSAVRSIEVVDERAVEFVVDAVPDVVRDVLTVPILPEHVWRDLVEGLDDETAVTEEWLRDAVLSDDVARVGSGPFAFGERSERDRLTLERFEDHFSLRSDVELPAPPVEEFRLRVAPNGASAIDLVDAGRADATVSALEAHVVDAAAAAEEASVVTSEARSVYHVGFNVRRAPFANPNFRQAVARLLDRTWLVESVFDGHADPVAVPADDETAPSAFEWNGADPVAPFAGRDGELDESAARDAFRDAGFRYDDDGRLVVNY
ncbi:ABC transporter substrate-binding protein [Halovivax sp.]|uniref:ABC transporter substrate-binding protein n=1 Tax=Halovivax sp. TaxID=1935978 RepID=UPI0025BA46DB|nr:ABC transporter substrate-binding protein [Halovivax sp.]